MWTLRSSVCKGTISFSRRISSHWWCCRRVHRGRNLSMHRMKQQSCLWCLRLSILHCRIDRWRKLLWWWMRIWNKVWLRIRSMPLSWEWFRSLTYRDKVLPKQARLRPSSCKCSINRMMDRKKVRIWLNLGLRLPYKMAKIKCKSTLPNVNHAPCLFFKKRYFNQSFKSA